MSNEALAASLAIAVPLRIAGLRGMARPDERDWAWLHEQAQVLAEHADTLQFGEGKSGEVAGLFEVLARSLAILAFQSGGVGFAGMVFNASGERGQFEHAS